MNEIELKNRLNKEITKVLRRNLDEGRKERSLVIKITEKKIEGKIKINNVHVGTKFFITWVSTVERKDN